MMRPEKFSSIARLGIRFPKEIHHAQVYTNPDLSGKPFLAFVVYSERDAWGWSTSPCALAGGSSSMYE